VLYVIDQRPFEAQLAQAKASLAQAEANLVNARQNLARQSRLIAQKAVSQQDYDTAVAQERSAAPSWKRRRRSCATWSSTSSSRRCARRAMAR
jgi:multidrug efflux pump subunit AcrA (membrane-fusion protein)